ncbi:hypothetical protein J416_02109 [Gracilibacillus halophilus YIM-C55.5]|uniref:Uncharacterized protein n=1 Tax=Gracilibacillus halophilus YIM-C55.5 TaxID=1308866 RepID=N4WUW1_9BACI|nr:hypothetical protein [Gracilibacillus halophilus]ENH98120.1 hypothetical protein J416_02109 [Gracilibacillus halophilus YIM-C55.5]
MLSDYDYSRFNEIIHEQVKDADGVNFIRYLTGSPDKKYSVICDYEVNENYVFPFDNDSNHNDKIYYGLHPTFDSELVIKGISDGSFRNDHLFEQFLLNNRDKFSLHEEYQSFVESIFAMTVLRMATRFGYKFSYTEKALRTIRKLIKSESVELVEAVTYKFMSSTKEIAFLGGFTDSLLKVLSKSNLVWEFGQNNCLQVMDRSESQKGYDFQSFYCYDVSPELCTGSVYYSGVLPRTYHVSTKESTSNKDIETIILHVERTTFATLDAFDNGEVCNHPLLQTSRQNIAEFFYLEDQAQEILFQKHPNQISREEMFQCVNKYLKYSPNTHTVAVSGNILDFDGNLLLGRRHEDSIDPDTYYCSVNGQSEFADHHVKFYKESVFEDYPTLQPNALARNDFNGELDRETEAELNIDRLSRNWEYYGISLLGIRNNKSIPDQKRRVHFNILAFNKVNESFYDIVMKSQTATEKFENQRIESLSIWFYKNWISRFTHYVNGVIAWISEYSNILTYLIAFLYLFLIGDIESLISGQTKDIVINSVTYLLALIALLHAVIKGVKKFSYNRMIKPYKIKSKYLYGNSNPIDRLSYWMNKQSKIQNAHPIATLMISLYILHKLKK